MNKFLVQFGKYFVFLLLFYVLHRANISGYHFFAFGMLVALVWCGNNPLILSPLYLLTSVLASFSMMYFWIDLVFVVVWLLAYFCHKMLKRPLNWLYLGIYALLGNGGRIYFALAQADVRLGMFVEIVLGIVVMYAYICYLESLITKGVRKDYLVDEILSLGVVVFAIGVGLSCLDYGDYFYSFVLAFSVLSVTKIFSPMSSIIFSIMYGLGGSFGLDNFLILAVSVAVGCVSAISFSNLRILSVICVTLAFVIVNIYFGVMAPSFVAISFAAGGVLFVLLPKKWFQFCSTLVICEDKSLIVPSIINETRRELSQKMMYLSDMFLDIKNIYFRYGAGGTLDENIDLLVQIVRKRLCSDCPNRQNCANISDGNADSIADMLRLAYERGKLFIIDAPPNMCAGCNNLSIMINTVNQVISEFRSKEQKNEKQAREKLLLSQSMGEVSELIKNFGEKFDEKIYIESSLEKDIIEALKYEKIICIEVKVLKKDNKLQTIVLLLKKHTWKKEVVCKVLSKLLRIDFFLLQVLNSFNPCFENVVLQKSPRYEVLYGCAGTTKSGSTSSGDTYSVTTISPREILFSICDGMGSGRAASGVSSTTIGLVESFFKAGFSSELILPIINRLLVLGDKEIFSALDVGVLDLDSGRLDILKFGSSTTYIRRDNDLVRLESSAMPLGILEEVVPKISSYMLKNDDYIMLFSDGVVDSFSTEELEMLLKNVNNLNPQTLANTIVKSALQKNGFIAKDDMTALVVRIIKKIN